MRLLPVAAAMSAVLLLAGGARAEDVKLSDLLASGFVIVGTDVIASEVGQRATGVADWKDDFMITLQRAGEIAFCHILLGATVSNNYVPNTTCFKPVVPPPAPETQSPPPTN